jgi:glycosyltransferase involved in cell wall biosynthesis
MRGINQIVWCVGHDLITGEAAIALSRLTGCRSAVIHHMSYADYYAYKSSRSSAAEPKRNAQRRIFNAADVALAVGPLLQSRLGEMIQTSATNVPVLIPGLADVPRSPERTASVNAIVLGRMDNTNERIKQGRLALSAFGSAIRTARGLKQKPEALLNSPRITLLGFDEHSEQELQRLAFKRAGGVFSLRMLPFSNREIAMRELAASNLALVTSWHEGFGLTAWEAISAGVPLVIGRNTGVYQLLNSEMSGTQDAFVQGVDVRASLDRRNGGYFRRSDETRVATAILTLAQDIGGALERARTLRALLNKYTWARTAGQLGHALNLDRYLRKLIEIGIVMVGEDSSSALPDRPFLDTVYESAEAATLLLSQARLSYGKGDYANVCAMSIRAADAFARCRRPTDAVAALVEAISALRPGRHGKQLRKIFLRVFQICEQNKVSRAIRWLFLDRLSLVLFDYARFSKAAEVAAASEQLLKTVVPDFDNPQRFAFDTSNSYRRRAIVKGSDGKLGDGSHLQREIDELLERAEQFRLDGHFNSFATNLDVASKLTAEVMGNVELAHEYSLRTLEYRQYIDHWWVLQEHLWREAEYYKIRGDASKKLQMVIEALKINQRAPVLLEPDARKPHEVRGDLREMLRRLEVDPLDLADHGVKIVQVLGSPLRISDQTIDAIVRVARN